MPDAKILFPTSLGCFGIAVILAYLGNWVGAFLFFIVGIVLALAGR